MKLKWFPMLTIPMLASFIALGMIHFEFPAEVQALINYILGVITISTLVVLNTPSKK
jgi:hypothetical protein